MDKNTRQRSKGSINGSSYNNSNNNGSGTATVGNKPPSRVNKIQTGKRPSGSFYGDNLNAAQCVEEIKNNFQASSIDADLQEPLSASHINGKEEASDQEEEDDMTQASPTKTASKKKPLGKLILCTQNTRYNVIKRVCRKMDYKLNDDLAADWDLYWSDVGVQPEQISKLRPHQRINSQPGMQALARKNNLSRNLTRMKKAFKEDFSFFPQTWVLPSDQNDFKNQFNKKKAKTFIVKPVNMCQGKGIYLTRRFEDIDLKSGDQFVAQRYMAKPYLIDDLKFDLRVYVLIFGVDPLRIFVFKEGLARFATESYVGPQKHNLDNLYMHLTNYAINKGSNNFVKNNDVDDDGGSKRTLTTVLDYMEENEPNFSREDMLDQIEDICVKTIIAVQPALSHAYRTCQPDDLENSMCFQILGMDVMIDQKLKPWLIEVNHLSSFGTDSPLDKRVKFDLIWDTFNLLNLSMKRKKKTKRERADQFSRRMHKEAPLTKLQKEEIKQKNMNDRDRFDCANLGGFRRSYPNPDSDLQMKYEYFLEESKALWNEFTNGTKPQEPSPFNYNNLTNNNSFNNSRTNPIGNQKAKAFDLNSPNPKQQPAFLNRVNNFNYQNRIGEQLQQQASKLSTSNSNNMQVTSSTTAGATASSSSSQPQQHANGPGTSGGFEQQQQNGVNLTNTPLSRGHRAARGDQPIILGNKQQSLSKSIKQTHATHLIFVDGDQVVDGNGYSYVDRRYTEGHRAMTLTDPPSRHQTDSKKHSANYRQMVEAASHDQKRYQNIHQQRAVAEQHRTSSLQKKFPMIKLDQHHEQYQHALKQNYGKMVSEDAAKLANPKCPLHGSHAHGHHHNHQHSQQTTQQPQNHQQTQQQQPPAFHKSNSHEVNYIIQQTMRGQGQQAHQGRLGKSPMQNKQYVQQQMKSLQSFPVL